MIIYIIYMRILVSYRILVAMLSFIILIRKRALHYCIVYVGKLSSCMNKLDISENKIDFERKWQWCFGIENINSNGVCEVLSDRVRRSRSVSQSILLNSFQLCLSRMRALALEFGFTWDVLSQTCEDEQYLWTLRSIIISWTQKRKYSHH